MGIEEVGDIEVRLKLCGYGHPGHNVHCVITINVDRQTDLFHKRRLEREKPLCALACG
jgi:hypothetical protein